MDNILYSNKYSFNNENLLNITQSNSSPKSHPRIRQWSDRVWRGIGGGGNYSVIIFFLLAISTNIFCRLI